MVTACAFFCWLFLPHYRTLAVVDIGDGQTIRIWDEESIDHPGFAVCYDVRGPGGPLVPATCHGAYAIHAPELATAFAGDRRLACVYDAKHDWYIIFDKESGESWPRLREDDSPNDLAVKQKWLSRFRRLKAENPRLPVPSYFQRGPGEPPDPPD
jgi:hypothetical protein